MLVTQRKVLNVKGTFFTNVKGTFFTNVKGTFFTNVKGTFFTNVKRTFFTNVKGTFFTNVTGTFFGMSEADFLETFLYMPRTRTSEPGAAQTCPGYVTKLYHAIDSIILLLYIII